MILKQIVRQLEDLYPLDLAEDWDEPGLIFGVPAAEVKKVLISVDICPQIVKQAIDLKCDLIITHHPLFFRSTHTLNNHRGQIIRELARNNIAHYVIHTNADNQAEGTRSELQKLVDQIPPNLELREYAQNLAQKFKSLVPQTQITLKVSGNLEQLVKKPYVMPGAGDSYFQNAFEADADVFISSDLRHHPVQDARSLYGFAIIDTPHFVSEYLWLYLLEGQIKSFSNNDIEVVRSEIVTDPWDMICL
jgi:dinuclear metal center YbgI/SA1388 family protein